MRGLYFIFRIPSLCLKKISVNCRFIKEQLFLNYLYYSLVSYFPVRKCKVVKRLSEIKNFCISTA